MPQGLQHVEAAMYRVQILVSNKNHVHRDVAAKIPDWMVVFVRVLVFVRVGVLMMRIFFVHVHVIVVCARVFVGVR